MRPQPDEQLRGLNRVEEVAAGQLADPPEPVQHRVAVVVQVGGSVARRPPGSKPHVQGGEKTASLLLGQSEEPAEDLTRRDAGRDAIAYEQQRYRDRFVAGGGPVVDDGTCARQPRLLDSPGYSG